MPIAELSAKRAVAVVAAAAIGLAACGGGGSSHVARLATSSGTDRTQGGGSSAATRSTRSGSSATRVPKGNPTQLLSEWTDCMRSHGDPDQAQPTIDASGAIHVLQPAGYSGPMFGPTGHYSTGAGVTCLRYLTAASTSLLGGEPLQSPDPATGDKFAACMRAKGVSNFPDPGAGASGSAGGSKPNPYSPTFEKAAKVCAQKVPQAASLGGPATLQRGQIEIDKGDGQVALIFA